TGRQRRLVWRSAALAAGLVALGLSLPRSFAVDRSSRAVGFELEFRIGNYLGGAAEFLEAFKGKHLLDSLFPGYETRDPDRVFMGSALVFVHYSAMNSDQQARPN